MTHDVTIENDRSELIPVKSRWQENHGNLLMVFVALILVVGSGVLIYRQTRFVPPRFPDSDMIAMAPDPGNANPEIGIEDVVIIRVTGAANDLGSIKIAIYENEQTFNNPDLALATNSLPLDRGEATWVVPRASLPSQIAVAAYHDENEDEQLTLNRFGIPSERYGFSNNARGLTGPPTYQQAVIACPDGGNTLNLFIR